MDFPRQLHVNPVVSVDHDVGDVVPGNQDIKRPQPEQVADEVRRHLRFLFGQQGQFQAFDNLFDKKGDFPAFLLFLQFSEFRQVQFIDEDIEDLDLDVLDEFEAFLGHRRCLVLALVGFPRLRGRRLAFLGFIG